MVHKTNSEWKTYQADWRETVLSVAKQAQLQGEVGKDPGLYAATARKDSTLCVLNNINAKCKI